MSLTVLVADDDVGIRVAIADYLELAGYIVSIAVDGQDALEKVQRDMPHLLIADINMPRLDGHELVQRIRRQPVFRLLPVIFLTERTEVQDRIRGYEVGCDVYLPKPFDLKELGVVVRSLLERSQLIESEWRVRLHNSTQNSPGAHNPGAHSPGTALQNADGQALQEHSPLASNPVPASQPLSVAESSIQLSEFTNREQEVLAFLSQGLSNNQIGTQLHLSPRTIEKYVSRLLQKTDTHNRSELLRFAVDHGLVDIQYS